jgi:hypothetical protein
MKTKIRRCMDCERRLTAREPRSCCVVCRLMRSRMHEAHAGDIHAEDEAIKRPRTAIYAARALRREPLFAA